MQDLNDIDYFRVEEWSTQYTYPEVPQRTYAIEAGQMGIRRFAANSDFELKVAACIRDRENGDTCSISVTSDEATDGQQLSPSMSPANESMLDIGQAIV